MPHLRKLLLGALAVASVSSAHASVTDVINITTLWRTRNDVNTDNFYTVDPSQRDLSLTCCGYYNIGAVAWLPAFQYPLTAGFARYWKGLPQNEHFYTSLAQEQSQVASMGWRFERFEGGVFGYAETGLAPFHRLNLYNGANGDLQHFYTTNQNEVNSLRSQGWGYDGIKAYVFELRTATRFPGLQFASNFSNQSIIDIPPISDPSGRLISVIDHKCGGSMSVIVNGKWHGPYDIWFYGISNGQYRCYTNGPWIDRTRTNTIQLVHTGFAAKVTPATWPSFWDIVPPTARTLTIGPRSDISKSTADVPSEDQTISDPLAVQVLLDAAKHAKQSAANVIDAGVEARRIPNE